jgi:hypothetical protein
MISSGLATTPIHPTRILQRKISKLGLILIGNHFEAFGRGQVNYAFHVALDWTFAGHVRRERGTGVRRNPQEQDLPGQPIEDWVEVYHKGSTTDELVRFGVEHGYITLMRPRIPACDTIRCPIPNCC